MEYPLYARMAQSLEAMRNCERFGNAEWLAKHAERLAELSESLPHGSGLDGTVKLDTERSKPDRLVIVAEFHHMDDNGYYDGWTEHDIIVTPSLASKFNIRITGRNYRDVKDYLSEVFYTALSEPATF